MPELPEVESIRRGLLPLVGKTVRGVEAKDALIFVKPLTPRNAPDFLLGRTLTDIRRIGKYLLFEFSHAARAGDRIDRTSHGRPDGSPLQLGTARRAPTRHSQLSGFLMFSLRMTGRALWLDAPQPPGTEKLVIDLGDPEKKLIFTTIRRFSRLYWIEPGELGSHPSLARLGVDPLTPGYTLAALKARAARRSGPLKSVFLNQQVVAGLGNIYVSELFARTRIDPRRKVTSLTDREWRAIFREIPKLLNEAIAAEGSSFNNYVGASGKPGGFQLKHRVYNRTGQPCRRCRAPIRRAVISGRATYFCSRCQQ